MITQYRSETAFKATQDALLVPTAINSFGEAEGFAGQVFERFPITKFKLAELGGLGLGEILPFGPVFGHGHWQAPHGIALAGIHRRVANGWDQAPEAIRTTLDAIAARSNFGTSTTVATAGIPGTGYSGLRGNADPEAIRQVLEDHPLRITVYQDSTAGDRAGILHAIPELDGAEQLQ